MMRKRNLSKKYEYGLVLHKESQVFKQDIYNRIHLQRLFSKGKILDLGCGHGTDAIILATFAKEVVGVDIHQYKEWKLFEEKNITFINANSTKLPFPDNAFDGVYLKDLLHHMKNGVNDAFEEIKRVTKPNGNIVILEANRYNPIFYLYTTRLRGHDHFTQNEFKSLITNKFSKTRFIHLEAYPPFRFPMAIYKWVLLWEKKINKLAFLKLFFAYNIVIIKNIKYPSKK